MSAFERSRDIDHVEDVFGEMAVCRYSPFYSGGWFGRNIHFFARTPKPEDGRFLMAQLNNYRVVALWKIKLKWGVRNEYPLFGPVYCENYE